jgi:hypothetical protein
MAKKPKKDSADDGKDKKPNKGDSSPKKKGGRPKKVKIYKSSKILKPLPELKLESRELDKYLANTIMVVYISLVDIEGVPIDKLKIEETKHSNTFLYFFENRAKGLTGYIGRAKTGEVNYLIMDYSRFKWAKAEGFINDANNLQDRELVFAKIGVFRELQSLMDFIKFLAGKPQYNFKGDYILTPQS